MRAFGNRNNFVWGMAMPWNLKNLSLRPGFLNWAFVDKVLTACEDYHVPAVMVIFAVGTVLDVYGKLTSTFVAFSGTCIGGILGHAFTGRKADDAADAPPAQPNA